MSFNAKIFAHAKNWSAPVKTWFRLTSVEGRRTWINNDTSIIHGSRYNEIGCHVTLK